MNVNKLNHRLSPFKIITLSFLALILLGTLLLMLPVSTRSGTGAPFFDALFTAVSATCVTGLTVHNTAEYWSLFGQVILLLLIQIGGLGVITIAIILTRFAGRKIGLMQRSTMQEAVAAPQVGGIVRLTAFILKLTLCAETAGAISMLPVFYRQLGIAKGIWYSVFHAVSAFCNAGFDLMGTADGNTSLMQYCGSPFVNIPVCLLIIAGGIGFLTWEDICRHKLRLRKYKMQSKAVLLTNTLLLLLPFLLFLCFEFTAGNWPDLSLRERILAAGFQAVSPRTAGFNTVDLTQMTDSSKLLTILLMLIGGTSGSTAGGMKTTTVAVLAATACSVFRKKPFTQCFGRRISDESIRHAATIFLMYFLLFIFSGLIICRIDGIPLLSALYETASAIGTVGLSLGVTPSLSLASKIILIFLMFFGRIGGLTLIFAVSPDTHAPRYKVPEEKITVG